MTKFYLLYTLGYNNEDGIYVTLAIYNRKRDIIEGYNEHDCAEYIIQGREWNNFGSVVMNKLFKDGKLVDVT